MSIKLWVITYDAQFLKHIFLVYSCRVELKSKEIVFNEEIPDYPANQMLRIVFKLLSTVLDVYRYSMVP